MSLSQKWGPQVFYNASGKRCESFSHEAFASMPLKVRQSSSRTKILFANNHTEILKVPQSNVLDAFGPFPEIEKTCRRL